MAKKIEGKRKINIFDVVVILLLICLLVTFGYRMYVGLADRSVTDDIKYVMSFECEQGYDSLMQYIEEDEAVYFLSNGNLLGYLYASPDDENGHIYRIFDDIHTFADGNEDNTVSPADYFNSVNTIPIQTYNLIRMGGYLRLNVEAVKVKNGNYYSIGEMNFAEGSVIEVCTDDTVFTLKVKEITISD